MNLFIYFSFVDFSNATLNIERLTEYLASLKNRYLKKYIYIYIAYVPFFLIILYVFRKCIWPRIFVFLMLISYSNWWGPKFYADLQSHK